MAKRVTLNVPHQLGRAEARRRIAAGFTKAIRQLPGGGGESSEHWEGDRLDFSVATMGQTIAGVVDVMETEVMIQIEMPGLIGLVAGSLRGQLENVGRRLLAKS